MTRKENLEYVVKKMKTLDFCMMVTTDGRGTHFSRPMSNNRQVEFDGDNWFFSYEDSDKVRQMNANARVSLIFQGEDMLFMQVYGSASIVKQKSKLAELWVKDLERWFPKGVETPGICLIHLKANKVQFWHKEKEGIIDF